jgi:hypothetical protein
MNVPAVLDATEPISASSISIVEIARIEAAFRAGFPKADARPHIRIWYGEHCYIPDSISDFLAEQSTPDYATRLSIRISDAKTRDEERYTNGAELIIGDASYYHVYANDQAWGGAVLRVLEHVFSPARRVRKGALGVFAAVCAVGAALQAAHVAIAFGEMRQLRPALLEPPPAYDSFAAQLVVFALLVAGSVIAFRRSFEPPRIVLNTDRSTRMWTIVGTVLGAAGLILGIASLVR